MALKGFGNNDEMMTDDHKDRLQRNLSLISKNLTNIDVILDILFNENILKQELIEKIRLQKESNDQCFELIRILIRHPDLAYHVFIFALKETNQHHIIAEMDPNYHQPTQDSIDSLNKLEEIDFEKIEMKPMRANLKMNILKDFDKVYNFKEAKYYGRALIINNYKFDHPSQSERIGAEQDTVDMLKCLKLLHYKVRVLRNLKKRDIINELQEEAKNSEHNELQSLVICLMSHGANECIYGVDGVDTIGYVTFNEITNIFNGDNCKALVGKPKIFFIQACQIFLRSTGSVNRTPIQVSNNEDQTKHPSSDIFIFVSSVPGEKSWRHPINGTLFIKALIYSIYTMAHEKPISSIANNVKCMVEARRMRIDGYQIQMPICTSTLTKDFYFMP